MESQSVIKTSLENVVNDAVTYTAHPEGKTVPAINVVYALKHQERTIHDRQQHALISDAPQYYQYGLPFAHYTASLHFEKGVAIIPQANDNVHASEWCRRSRRFGVTKSSLRRLVL